MSDISVFGRVIVYHTMRLGHSYCLLLLGDTLGILGEAFPK